LLGSQAVRSNLILQLQTLTQVGDQLGLSGHRLVQSRFVRGRSKRR
jgi:hypothetical protein